MLSVIISSYQPHYFSALEQNIAETIGVPNEIIKIDNPNLMGICEAYNLGAGKAKYENLLFLHDDVEFTTQNWGKTLLNYLGKPKCGVIGLAGSTYVPNVPFCWWDNFETTFRNINQYSGSKKLKAYELERPTEVLVIDGVFIGCKKSLYEKIKFNEAIAGFHGYDIDFSVRAADIAANFVIHDIQVNHFSEGKPDKNWWNNLVKYRPLFSAPKKQNISKKMELFFYKKLEEKLQIFRIQNKKEILLKYNNPKYVGYKACAKNFFKIIFS